MTPLKTNKQLAEGWINAWAQQDYQWLEEHLCEDMVHTSPFGSLRGRQHYLSVVIPMAKKSVQRLTIQKVIAAGDEAAVWFVNDTPAGQIPSCDWITSAGGRITHIQSFYDTAKVRAVLSEDDQSTLSD